MSKSILEEYRNEKAEYKMYTEWTKKGYVPDPRLKKLNVFCVTIER